MTRKPQPRCVRMVLFLLAIVSTATGVDASNDASLPASQSCMRVSLQGEVSEGNRWSAPLGEGWILQLLPISGKAYADGQAYTGWDLTVNRSDANEYPDALLLATPPYGSLNAREIGTTYGMRAQDAIAWEPRHFRFLTSMADLAQARELYARVMPGKEANAGERTDADTKLLALLKSARQGSGQLQIEDARLIPGTADPPLFAQAWIPHLRDVPHSYEQSYETSARGKLRWMRFSIVLWFPQTWKVPRESHAVIARCAE